MLVCTDKIIINIMLCIEHMYVEIDRFMGARKGAGKSRRLPPPPPGKYRKTISVLWRHCATLFSLCGGGVFFTVWRRFCYIFLHVGAFFLRFSSCGGFFCCIFSSCGGISRLPLPPTKTSAGAHGPISSLVIGREVEHRSRHTHIAHTYALLIAIDNINMIREVGLFFSKR